MLRTLVHGTTLVWLVAACGSVNTRPYLTPVPEAIVDTLSTAPDNVINTVARAVVSAGLRIRAVSAREGYLETDWYDVMARRPSSGRTLAVRRNIKMRFWADSVGLGRSQLVSEAVIRRSADPSLPARDAEMMVPDDHPGRQVLGSVLDSLRIRFGTGPT